MNISLQTVTVFFLMILFSITGVSNTQAGGIGECGDLHGDCFTRAYVGASFGINTLDSETLSTALSVFDDSSSTYGVVAGYRFNKFFGVETSANYFGKQNYFVGLSEITSEIFNVGFGGNIYLPIGEAVSNPNINFVSILVKAGMHYWDAQADFDTTGTIVYSDEGINLYYGYGLNVDVFRFMTLRAEYTMFPLDDSDSIDNASVKVLFKF